MSVISVLGVHVPSNFGVPVVTESLLCARYIHTFSHFNSHNSPLRLV